MNSRYSFQNLRMFLKLVGILLGILLLFYYLLPDEEEVPDTPKDIITILNNVWLIEIKDGTLHYFDGSKEEKVRIQGNMEDSVSGGSLNTIEDIRGEIADIHFKNDTVSKIVIKDTKINGKLLNVSAESITLEDKGSFPLSDQFKAYRIYGGLSLLSVGELPVGSSNADYIVVDGKVEACLLVKEESMENIRVLIRNNDFASEFHSSVTLSADVAYRVSYGDGLTEEYAAGEELSIDPDHLYFENKDRIIITPEALTGRIKISSLVRTQGAPQYRGVLEISKAEQGLLLVNEVLLEEYLYAVVPSEMPSSYPPEALKAQAICARTYAYNKMLFAGLGHYGAHVDDSTNYQVYQNITENAATTDAVLNTKGEILSYQDRPAQTYYYSTSGGRGTTPDIWSDGNADTMPYLQAWEEEKWEKNESWFRWTAEADTIQEEELTDRLMQRYHANPSFILTEQKDGSFVSEPIEKLGNIKEISVVKRGEGDIAEELLIEGSEKTVLVKKELSIRHVLNTDSCKVIRADGSETKMPTILPSAFFTIETRKEKGNVVGYTLSGGGYGHGVGMSQNAAKNMAQEGMSTSDILTFFYKDCEIETIY